uniref:Amino acid transporter transmembrane domain-containing protein n=1 Tax=Ananas comosus var. bracteatus TaxID=296719 RepID=A0A6V7NI68_ANACO|nr:unnamed protein product [Ananas comosus var. bracteatus]
MTGESAATHYYQHAKLAPMDVASVELENPQGASKCFDDDGRLKRTGCLAPRDLSVWTASAHIITAVIGSGVLSLAWAIAQLGWVAGPAVMLLFSFVTYYTSALLADCYRAGDPSTGKRNYTYMDAVNANLNGIKVKICGVLQYANIFGVAIGYTIAASISMMAIKRSNCFHEKGKDPCLMSSNPYMILFGSPRLCSRRSRFRPDLVALNPRRRDVLHLFFHRPRLGILQVIGNGGFKGSLTGISIGVVTPTDKVWRSLQAFGDIAFAYSYSLILIEIQDTIKARRRRRQG